jgi:lysophospholipase L1-like esterase
MPDARLGHRLKPNARARYTTLDFSTDLAVNSEGVRDDEDIGPKAPDERRVLVLGDSLVLSVQVAFAQTFTELAEARLNRAGGASRWRLINAGVQGYGPVEESLFFEHVGAAFEPDVVLIVLFVGNDAVEAYDRESWLEAGGRPAGAVGEATANRFRRLVRQSMVLQIVQQRVEVLRWRLVGDTPERPLTSYLADPPAEVRRGLEMTRAAVERLAARASAIHARTAIVLMPARFQTDDADYGRLAEIVRAAGGELVRNSASERFRQALAPLGLPLLDLLPVLEAQPNRRDLFFQENVHLTPRGHEVVADALAGFLSR